MDKLFADTMGDRNIVINRFPNDISEQGHLENRSEENKKRTRDFSERLDILHNVSWLGRNHGFTAPVIPCGPAVTWRYQNS